MKTIGIGKGRLWKTVHLTIIATILMCMVPVPSAAQQSSAETLKDCHEKIAEKYWQQKEKIINDKTSLKKEIAELRRKSENLEWYIERLKEHEKDMEKKIQEYEKRIEVIEREIETLKSIIDFLPGFEFPTSLGDLVKQLAELPGALVGKLEKTRYDMKIVALEGEKRDLEKWKKHYERRLQDTRERILKNEMELMIIKRQLEEKETKLESLQEELQNLEDWFDKAWKDCYRKFGLSPTPRKMEPGVTLPSWEGPKHPPIHIPKKLDLDLIIRMMTMYGKFTADWISPIVETERHKELFFELLHHKKVYNENIQRVPGWVKDLIDRKMVCFIKMDDTSTLILKIVSDENHRITEIDEMKEEEIADFNPSAEIHTDEKTVRDLMESDDPAIALKLAIEHGKVTIRGRDIGSQIKYGVATFFGRIVTKFTPSPYDVKQREKKEILFQGQEGILKRSALGYRVVEIKGQAYNLVVIDDKGVQKGHTTTGIQRLIEADPKGLSPYTGVIAGLRKASGKNSSLHKKGEEVIR